ncbi:iron chelate uptake ABC transporter family permease subunit [Cellulomonas sp. ACRRI]|uniref:FecCD family ABC transporter permease n=1 Tax=Cellulomonas sp. ACRRI TaxID=2918188 RepID=UPI001EF32749|nr:iron chelate uptake ABC transporter family permease subunit [Cellulomonas sp. ACRRI]MCG7285617.1 iron chelate uptake ABC transporter family permease subunit [Cellulomonas sp. ACRRI]
MRVAATPTPGAAPRRPAGPRRRPRLAVAGLAVAALLLALVALGVGDYPLGVVDVVRALVTDQGFATTIVTEWRLPRVLVALVFGAALAVSGALFQSVTRNPLGSPDVIGFSTGSYTGVLVVTTVLGTGTLGVSAGALVAGLLTALVVYLLAYRDGVQGFRLIVVGIGVTGMLHGVNVWLLLRAKTEVALAASIWGAGSLSLVGWSQALPAVAVLAVLAPLVWAVRPSLRQLELGDDAASAHGVRVEASRLAVVVLGVALIATVTATAGPIAFVALAAPQIARRLTGSAGLPLVASALTGAVVLLAADVLAQHVLPTALPVGVVTVVLGGVYLLALIVREARRRW